MPGVTELQLTILLIVRDEGPIHGHAIRKLVPSYSEGQLKGNLSSSYEALYRLEGLGYLSSSEITLPDGRVRRQYRLTALGASVLDLESEAARRLLRRMAARPRLRAAEG